MSSSKALVKHNSSSSDKSDKPSKPNKPNKDDARSQSSQRECEHVYQGIKRWKAHDGAVLLPVVRKGTVSLLNERAKPRWWKVKVKKTKAVMCITTPQTLQQEIDSSASHGQVHELFLLISRHVEIQQLQINVPSTVDNLYIIRCANESKRPGSVEANRKLVLNGGSTFCGVRLDEWQSKRVGEHNIILGPDVAIQLSMGIPWTARDALAVISKQQREEVCKHFKEMCEAKCEGNPQWDKWRDPVNKLLDVAAGTSSLAQVVECYAGGIVVQAATTLTASGIEGAFRVSAGLLCLSGPGQMALIGVGAAAAIYYIPWDTVWGWFRSAFGAFLSWLMRAWENLKSWVQTTVTEKGPALAKQAIVMSIHPILTA